MRVEESESLTATVAGMRDRASCRDVLVFVPGYNVSFVNAVRRTAQLAYDLDFGGVPVLYSWPSAGSAAAYVADGAAADFSGTAERYTLYVNNSDLAWPPPGRARSRTFRGGVDAVETAVYLPGGAAIRAGDILRADLSARPLVFLASPGSAGGIRRCG